MSEKKIVSMVNMESTPENLSIDRRTKTVDPKKFDQLSQLSKNELRLVRVVDLYVAISISDGYIISIVAQFGVLIAYITGDMFDILPFTVISLLMYVATFGSLDKMLARGVNLVVS